MAVKREMSCLLLCYPVLQLSSRLELFGMTRTTSILKVISNITSIYRPARTATQSGDWHEHQWRMDWDALAKGHRWENPLMGWQSTADFMQGTHMNFKSKEDAIRFADKQGYEYFVQEPNNRKIIPKAYANNFLWSDKKLKHIRTK
jgi:NADH dehydrogenase (ubiquinone) Fe-S protein 4